MNLSHDEVLEIIKRERLVAILRGVPAERLDGVVAALIAGGVRVLEFTFDHDRENYLNPIIARLAKASCKDGYGADMNTAILVECLYQALAFGTKDHLEGIDAFLEKRPPEFTGE